MTLLDDMDGRLVAQGNALRVIEEAIAASCGGSEGETAEAVLAALMRYLKRGPGVRSNHSRRSHEATRP